MFCSLGLLLVAMVIKKKEFGLKWPKNVKRHFLHIHISNNTPILILFFICWNIKAQRE